MRIALVSDTHLAARAAVCLDNWRVVQGWIERARPDLVVHLGDITVDGASDAVELRDAVDAFAGLDVPIRFLPGNHDIGDNPIAPEVGLLMLMLDGTDHRFAVARPEGLRRNNILDHPELDPGVAELRAALGARAIL